MSVASVACVACVACVARVVPRSSGLFINSHVCCLWCVRCVCCACGVPPLRFINSHSHTATHKFSRSTFTPTRHGYRRHTSTLVASVVWRTIRGVGVFARPPRACSTPPTTSPLAPRALAASRAPPGAPLLSPCPAPRLSAPPVAARCAPLHPKKNFHTDSHSARLSN